MDWKVVELDKSKYDIKCPNKMKPIGITIHETDNNASAVKEIEYMQRRPDEVSFHFAVDELGANQGLPLDRNGWHSGDGHGNGNRKTIGIEICRNRVRKDGSVTDEVPKEYYVARENAEKLVGQLMRHYGFTEKDIYTHNDWNGKNCPRNILEDGYLAEFKKNASKYAKPTPKPKPKPQSKGEVLHLPKSAKDWRVYKMDVSPVVGNEVGKLFPAKFGGLEYDVLGYRKGDPNVAHIQTRDFGKVQIYIGKETGAKVTGKKAPKPDVINVGSKVTVTADRYTTGQKVPLWVKSRKYTVQEISNGKVLLKEIQSRVLLEDVKL